MTKERKVSEKYDLLYHYTNMGGVMGILDSQKIWCTDLNYLNDNTEGKIAQQKIVENLIPHAIQEIKERISSGQMNGEAIERDGGVEFLVEEEMARLVDICYRSLGGVFCVTSLCGKNKDEDLYEHKHGRLSQWRGYGNDGGVAVIFDAKKLEEMLPEETKSYDVSLGLGDVFYDFDDLEQMDKELKNDLDALHRAFVTFAMSKLKEVYFNETPAEEEDVVRNGYSALFQLITRYKHQSFSEETEVRFYAHRFKLEQKKGDSRVKPLKYRGDAVPYIELFDLVEGKLPIVEIIVGPHKNKERRAEGLRSFIEELGLDISVTISDIPYVE